jgi:hypothetical protein
LRKSRASKLSQEWHTGIMLELPHTLNTAVPTRSKIWVDNNLSQLVGTTPASGRSRHVILTAFSRFGFGAKGKVYIPEYFPAFTARLAEQDIDCSFVWNEDGLEAAADARDTAILHLYNEEKACAYNDRIRAVEARASMVFCPRRAGAILAHKPATNRFLTARGVAMPEMLDTTSALVPVFSNSAIGSGHRTIVTDTPEALAPDRYNTRYIDTRRTFGNKTYHTMFRIQSIGQQVLHAYPRARDVAQKSASVHSKDTPADGPLIEFLFDELIRCRWDEIAVFTRHLGKILGPGSYAHDMVVCNQTGAMYMVESGLKFNDTPYADYIASAAPQMPGNAIFYSGQYAVQAADLFVQEWDWAKGMTVPDPAGRDLQELYS